MLLHRLKSIFRRFWLRRHGVNPEITCARLDLGVANGTWTVSPDNLNAQSIVYSFGIGTDISFDLALISMFQAVVHAFDPTPRAKGWIQSQSLPANFVYHDYGIAGYDGLMKFYPPKRAQSPHFTPVLRYKHGAATSFVSVPVRTLKTLMNMLGHDHLDLLKLDIEGGEYDVIENILADRIPIRQLLVEFHHNYRTIPLHRTVRALRCLRDAGYRIFNISRRTLEFSLLRAD